MKYPIYVYGSSVLREVSKNISKDYQGLNNLIEDMFASMYESEGVGLAAPQIGKPIRLFVVDGSPWKEDDPAMADFKRVFINAEIYDRFGEEEYFTEGCLSVPGVHEDVLRFNTIKMRYLDENFVQHDEEFSGYAARVIQHEYDHLEGMLFTDHLSPLRKKLVKSKLDKISKGNFKSAFPCKLVK